MRPDLWKKVEETYHAALELDPERRPAFLDAACIGDPELRKEVESLLHEARFTENFLESKTPTLVGRTLSHYRIGSLLGAGGMADVYRARDTKLERDVALKVLQSTHLFGQEQLTRLYREARLLASLNHPNIASVYGLVESDGICGLVLELVEGETLAERIGRGPILVHEAIGVAIQIASGVAAAHDKGIIHRDLKPSNIKIARDGTAKVLDFGLARMFQPPDSATETAWATISREGAIAGTISYMSPEQARGKPIDARTDVWAFGCVLYEMLYGRRAFDGATLTDVLVKLASEEPEWNGLPALPSDESEELQQVIRRCLQKNPDLRYPSLHEAVEDLEGVPTADKQNRSNRRITARHGEPDFVLPGKSSRPLFLIIQVGYLALYSTAMFYVEQILGILERDFLLPEGISLAAMIVLAMSGVAVRLYLLSSVGWRHPAAGRKFEWLFPLLLILDSFWAASPLLLWRRAGFGAALTGVALMAYLPFSQRTLIRSIYAGTYR